MKFTASCVGALVATISVARVQSFSIARHDVVLNAFSLSSTASHRRQQQHFSRSEERKIIHYSSSRDVKFQLCAKPEDEIIIDAIVEEKTAGLALDDEENTTVSIKCTSCNALH